MKPNFIAIVQQPAITNVFRVSGKDGATRTRLFQDVGPACVGYAEAAANYEATFGQILKIRRYRCGSGDATNLAWTEKISLTIP